MRRFLIGRLICIVLLYTTNCFNDAAQTVPNSSNDFYQPNIKTKVTIQLNNDSIIVGEVFKIGDSCLTILFVDREPDSIYRTVCMAEMHSVKVKRDAFLQGMFGGILIGGLIGYGAGSIAYEYDHSLSSDENDENQNVSGWTGAVIGAVPCGVLGGIIGGVALKKRFAINGRQENFTRMVNALWR